MPGYDENPVRLYSPYIGSDLANSNRVDGFIEQMHIGPEHFRRPNGASVHVVRAAYENILGTHDSTTLGLTLVERRAKIKCFVRWYQEKSSTGPLLPYLTKGGATCIPVGFFSL